MKDTLIIKTNTISCKILNKIETILDKETGVDYEYIDFKKKENILGALTLIRSKLYDLEDKYDAILKEIRSCKR